MMEIRDQRFQEVVRHRQMDDKCVECKPMIKIWGSAPAARGPSLEGKALKS